MGFGERKAYFLSIRPNPKFATWFGKKKKAATPAVDELVSDGKPIKTKQHSVTDCCSFQQCRSALIASISVLCSSRNCARHCRGERGIRAQNRNGTLAQGSSAHHLSVSRAKICTCPRVYFLFTGSIIGGMVCTISRRQHTESFALKVPLTKARRAT